MKTEDKIRRALKLKRLSEKFTKELKALKAELIKSNPVPQGKSSVTLETGSGKAIIISKEKMGWDQDRLGDLRKDFPVEFEITFKARWTPISSPQIKTLLNESNTKFAEDVHEAYESFFEDSVRLEPPKS